mgnify:CR=1 FL=1
MNDICADLRKILEMIASVDEPDYAEVERIANRNGFVFAEDGSLVDVWDTITYRKRRTNG